MRNPWLALPWRRIDSVPRLATGAVVLLAILASGLQVVATLVVDESLVTSRLQRAVEATDGSWSVEVDATAANLLGRSLRLSGVRLVRRTRTADPNRSSTGDGDSVFLRQVKLDGVAWIPLLARGELRAGTLHLTAPHARIATVRGLFERGEDESEAGPGVSPSTASIRLDSVHVTGGTLITEPAAGPGGGGLRIGLGTLSLRDVAVGSRAAADTTRILFARGVDLHILALGWQSSDSLSAFAAGPIRTSNADSLLEVQDLRLAPRLPDERFFRALRYRTDRRRISIHRSRASGFDLRRLVAEGAIVARRVDLDSLRVDVLSDHRMPARPAPTGVPKGGHRLRFDRRFRLDTVRLSADVRYAERREEASRPARVSFERLTAIGYNLTNEGAHASTPEPAVVNAEAWIYGATRARVTFRVPLVSTGFRMSYQGGLGRTRLQDFNALTVPLEGVRIGSGAVDTLWFRVAVAGDTATGETSGIYRDFSVRFVDRDSGEGAVFKDIKSWFVNWLVVDGSNEPRDDRPLRVGTVAQSIQGDDTIFEVVWKSLRSGLLDLGGL